MRVKEALLGLSLLLHTGCGIQSCGNPTEEARRGPSIPQVTTADFGSRVLRSERPVVVDFYADWCPACRGFEEPYAQASLAMRSQADFVRYDLEQSRSPEHVQLLQRYQIEFIPAVIVFRGGEAICRPEPADAAAFQRSLEACLID